MLSRLKAPPLMGTRAVINTTNPQYCGRNTANRQRFTEAECNPSYISDSDVKTNTFSVRDFSKNMETCQKENVFFGSKG